MTRADLIVVAFALVLLPSLYMTLWGGGGPGDTVRIVDASGTETIASLGEARTLAFDGPLGESIIEIRDGAARFVASPCRGKHCIHAGWQRDGGDVTACLPNRITLAVAPAGPPRYDSINF